MEIAWSYCKANIQLIIVELVGSRAGILQVVVASITAAVAVDTKYDADI